MTNSIIGTDGGTTFKLTKDKLTEKASPVNADLVPIYDSEDGDALKSAQLGNL